MHVFVLKFKITEYVHVYEISIGVILLRLTSYPYENIQQYFSNSMAEIETRLLAGFLLLLAIIKATLQL